MKTGDIRRLRLYLGWPQETLARELGVSFSTVNRWENDKSAPSPMAKKILEGLIQRRGLASHFSGNSVEKRDCRRVNLRCPLHLRRLSDIKEAELSYLDVDPTLVYTEDLSLNGLRFKTNLDIKTGDELDIRLGASGACVVMAKSRAVWAGEMDGVRQVGLSFDRIKPEDLLGVVADMILN